jgi:RNA polymerase sigma-70 factor (ECF subfamily)
MDSPHPSPDVTRLLHQWRDGDEAALAELTPLVYAELRRLAGSYLRRERSGHTLQPTALVNEAYMRLAGQKNSDWQSRNHFIGVAANAMRQILVDHARRHLAGKRGGGNVNLSFEDALSVCDERSADLIALDDALKDLAVMDPRKARAIELRHFGGLTIPEIAQSLSISVATVERDLRMAQMWILRHIRGENPA